MQSVASFIGSDGTNPTTNSGRLSITLKPLDERSLERRRDHRAPAAEARAGRRASQVYLQSVQDLQIDSRVGRTQFQYTLEDADPAELGDLGAEAAWRSSARSPCCRTWRATRRRRASRCRSTIDRDTASRLGISPQMIDDTLYDAFGQRQVSIIFTQLNLYRVILEVKPDEAQTPRALDELFVRTPTGAPVPLEHDGRTRRRRRRRWPSTTRGSSRRSTLSFNLAPGESLGDAVNAIAARAGAHRDCRRASTPTSRGRRRRSTSRWPASRSSSSRRSSPSTSSSAFSTRATSTRSRSSRRSRRRASARCSRSSCAARTSASSRSSASFSSSAS